MDFRYLYTSFDGRINRKPFWLACLLMVVAGLILSIVIVMPLSAVSTTLGAVASLILSLAFLYPAIALGVKRLHDQDKPGTLMAVFLAPSLATQLGDLLGMTGSERTIAGQAILLPNTLGWLLNIVTLVIGIWALVTLGFRKGTSGPNSFGADPLVVTALQPAAQ